MWTVCILTTRRFRRLSATGRQGIFSECSRDPVVQIKCKVKLQSFGGEGRRENGDWQESNLLGALQEGQGRNAGVEETHTLGKDWVFGEYPTRSFDVKFQNGTSLNSSYPRYGIVWKEQPSYPWGWKEVKWLQFKKSSFNISRHWKGWERESLQNTEQ